LVCKLVFLRPHGEAEVLASAGPLMSRARADGGMMAVPRLCD